MRGEYTSDGIWMAGQTAKPEKPLPGLILDRDGVVIEEIGYLHRPEDVRLEPGLIELLKWTQANGIPVAVVTNQAGVDRGYFGWPDYHSVEAEIDRQLEIHGISLDMVVACPFHPCHTESYGTLHEYWRKPGPGMLRLAGEWLGLDLARSWMIGDRESDVSAAKAAGLGGAIHVLRGHGAKCRELALSLAEENFPVIASADLVEALGIVIHRLAGTD